MADVSSCGRVTGRASMKSLCSDGVSLSAINSVSSGRFRGVCGRAGGSMFGSSALRGTVVGGGLDYTRYLGLVSLCAFSGSGLGVLRMLGSRVTSAAGCSGVIGSLSFVSDGGGTGRVLKVPWCDGDEYAYYGGPGGCYGERVYFASVFCSSDYTTYNCRRRAATIPRDFVVRVRPGCDVDSRWDDLVLRFSWHDVFDLSGCFFVEAKAATCGIAGADGGVAGRVDASGDFAYCGTVVFDCAFSFSDEYYYYWRGLSLFWLCVR